MISNSEETMTFIRDFDGITRSLKREHDPQWLKELRSESLSRFQLLGIPTSKTEDWKYFNLQPLLKHNFSWASASKLNNLDHFKSYLQGDTLTVVLVNGVFSHTLSQLKNCPKGLKIISFKDAIAQKEIDLKTLLMRFEFGKEKNPFVALNNIFTSDGALIKIDDKAVIKDLIHILHVTSVSKEEMATFPRSVIISGKSSEATILESYVSLDDESVYFNNPLTEIIMHKNAVFNYCKAQNESFKAYHIGTTRVWQEQNSNFHGFSLATGGNLTRNDLDIVLNGEGASGILNGLYSISGNQLVDNHTCVDHKAPNCTSNQLYKGILNGSSRAIFNGKIIVRSIAQKTNSYQLNKNLLLGKNSQIDTKPQLEIFADDVKCTHGATIGQLNEDEIFYLRSRCIAKKEAIKMLAVGFVDDVLERIPNQSIIDRLHFLLKPSLEAI